jgi:DNA-directed RNA polymerase specialized sigma24 family protein
VNKVQQENTKRLELLFRQSHNWLTAVAFNLSKDKEVADELVAELYLYLAEKCNPSLWYLNSFNLMYAHSFLKSRFLNRIKSDKRKTEWTSDNDDIVEDYDIDTDERLEDTYNAVVDELKAMERTRKWASSKLYQLYAFDKEMTLERLASEIGISKSTAFLQTKKAKIHLRTTIPNPFKSKS